LVDLAIEQVAWTGEPLDVDGRQNALFVSFDAPAYDPSKTVYLE
jgi:hypothetical protein